MKPDFLPPKGSYPKDPAGFWETVRLKIQEFFRYLYLENANDVVRIDKFLTGTETDHTEAFKEALDYCRDNQKDLLLGRNATYVISDVLRIENLRIFGNFAKIDGRVPVDLEGFSAKEYMSTGVQDAGTSYNLDENVLKGDRSIKITNTSFLSNVKIGDIVLIRSSAIFGDDLPSGELHKVYAVHDWGIYIDDYMFHPYLVSDTARISIIPMRTCEVYDLELIHQSAGEEEPIIGITARNCKYPIFSNVQVRNTRYRALTFINCYKPYATRCYTSGTPKSNNGYGISVSGVTTNAIIENCIMTGARHPFHSGGSLYGVPWNIMVRNCRASTGFSLGGTCYDAHRSVGSVTFENCHAYGGQTLKDDTTPVNFGWNLRIVGQINIKNCYGHKLRRTIVGSTADVGHVVIENLTSYDCDESIYVENTNIKSIIIDGLRHFQSVTKENYGILISCPAAVVEQLEISDVLVIGQRVMTINVTDNCDPIIRGVTGKLGSVVSGSIGIRLTCLNRNPYLTGIKLYDYDYPIWAQHGDNFSIELYASNYNQFAVYSYNNIKSMTIYGRLQDPRTTNGGAFYARENVTQVMIPHLTYIGSNDFYLAVANTGKTWDSLQYGNISVEGTGTLLREFNLATPPCPIILAGSNKDVRDCIVQATPEGSITARPGAIARDEVNGKVYFKATGTGNTGWREIQFV